MKYKLKQQVKEIFQEYMLKNEINQTQLADRLSINKSIITKLIHEQYNLSLDTLEEYCNKLGIDINLK
jgi:plasmid maintenance system antidote protein VapI